MHKQNTPEHKQEHAEHDRMERLEKKLALVVLIIRKFALLPNIRLQMGADLQDDINRLAYESPVLSTDSKEALLVELIEQMLNAIKHLQKP